MTPHGSPEVAARLRRLDLRVREVEVALAEADVITRSEVSDSIAAALDALYDAWELWKASTGLRKTGEQDAAVTGNTAGDTTLALVCARGAKTHAFAENTVGYRYGTHGFGEGPFGGGWVWAELEDDRYPTRRAWYEQHVDGRSILSPLSVARAWLEQELH